MGFYKDGRYFKVMTGDYLKGSATTSLIKTKKKIKLKTNPTCLCFAWVKPSDWCLFWIMLNKTANLNKKKSLSFYQKRKKSLSF